MARSTQFKELTLTIKLQMKLEFTVRSLTEAQSSTLEATDKVNQSTIGAVSHWRWNSMMMTPFLRWRTLSSPAASTTDLNCKEEKFLMRQPHQSKVRIQMVAKKTDAKRTIPKMEDGHPRSISDS